jgi:hypothetical protein
MQSKETKFWIINRKANSGNRNLFEEKHTYSNEAHTKSQIIHSVDRPSKLPEEAVLQTQSDSQLMLTVQ